jgi:hypothetical protein
MSGTAAPSTTATSSSSCARAERTGDRERLRLVAPPRRRHRSEPRCLVDAAGGKSGRASFCVCARSTRCSRRSSSCCWRCAIRHASRDTAPIARRFDGRGVYPRPVQQPLPVWVALGGTPQPVARAGTLGLPMALAIIGGEPERFVPLVELYREAARRAGYDPATLPVGINPVARRHEGGASGPACRSSHAQSTLGARGSAVVPSRSVHRRTTRLVPGETAMAGTPGDTPSGRSPLSAADDCTMIW